MNEQRNVLIESARYNNLGLFNVELPDRMLLIWIPLIFPNMM